MKLNKKPPRELQMKVILKPISHPQVGEICIDDELFAIGRNEEPFASRLGEAVTRLSRRHARIFQEDGKVFIVDLGSLNGTRVNQKPLKNGAAVLQARDIITLGDEFSFRVELKREAAHSQTLSRAASMRLTLTPVDPDSGIEAISVERFPFLIARIDSAFEQYKERFPDALRKISRRHAVIALKGDQLYIEDLESSNGTYIGGKRLDERAQHLADGDTVMFGSEQFSYRVRVESEAEATRFAKTLMAGPGETMIPAAAAAEQSAPEQPPTGNRTRFVSSADSFLNVFCAESGEEGNAVADKSKDAGETAVVQSAKAPGRLQKLRASLGQFWRTFSGRETVDRKIAWGAAAVFGLVVAVAAGGYLLGHERREIKSLLEDGQYVESAATANRYLEKRPDDLEAKAWAEEALTKAAAPTWIAFIEKGQLAAAADYLKNQRDAHRFIPDGQKMLDTLAWAGEVEAHIAARGGISAPIVLFRDEETIRKLVGDWDKDSYRRQQLMDQIVSREPGFEPVQRRVYSNLRALRSENGVYVKAIAELKTELRTALQSGDPRRAGKLIEDFASSYPRVAGVDALKADLASYETLSRLAKNKELPELIRLSRTTKFRTPIFAEHIDGWLVSTLPPAQIVAQHAAAAAAWDAGEHDQAIATLKPLTAEPWGEVAVRQIARYQKVQSDYEALLAARGSDAYEDKLLAVWGALRPAEDAHLIRTLEPDFLSHKEKLVPRLDESLRRAKASWDEYQNDGGISGVVRVEARVSERFARQAKRLSSAYDEVARSARTHDLLQVARPPEWQSLEGEIINEVRRQRRWLEDLNIVLDPALLGAKLDLLPDTSEQSSWVSSTTAQERD